MKNFRVIIIVLSVLFFVWGCSNPTSPSTSTPNQPAAVTEPPSAESPAVTPTLTPTPAPAAARVNGVSILLSDYEEEYLRYVDGMEKSGTQVEETLGRATVLENMIDILLLAQSARENGFQLTEDMYQERLNGLISQLGDAARLQTWLTENHYSEQSFERLYKLEIEAAYMRDLILAEVPTTAEQIRARQIMVSSKTRADEVFAQLQAGADFATLAWIYDPITGGELSWFPRNYLVVKEVEEAVFSLGPGEYTPVIETVYGYQIIQVMDREMDRVLTQDALFTYQRSALTKWIQDKKSTSSISIEIS